MATKKTTTKRTTRGARGSTQSNVFDVAKPGAPNLGASSTSRPIIIKHQNMPDPMVNDNPSPEPKPVEATASDTPQPEAETTPTLVSPSAKKIVIQPLHLDSDDASDNVAVKQEEVKAEEPEIKPDTAPEEPKTVSPAKPEDTKAQPDKPVIDDEKDAADKVAKITKLVESEEFFLPIETIEQRRSKRAAILGTLLIIVLLLAWYNVALDASLLPNTYNLPHTSFFSAK